MSSLGDDAGPTALSSSFAVRVVSFEAGPGAGHGADKLPGVVLGPPHGGQGAGANVDDVLSLGQGGVIVLELGDDVVDAPGTDLIVFENPFAIAGGGVFGEPGEVAVSLDGSTFTAFPCDADHASASDAKGCAGYGIVRASPDNDVDATDPSVAGGDDFDLATIGAPRARFVRITDRGHNHAAPSAGFDLDAVAIAVHAP